MVSEATKITVTTRYDIISTVIFPEFTFSWNRSYKINKTNMLATNLIYTGSSTQVIDLKILPESRNNLNMYQALILPDQLLMQ